jgi:hypothetical protein
MASSSLRPIEDHDVAWLHSYEASTLAYFRPRFAACAPRFTASETLFTRFSAAIRDVIGQGRSLFRAVDETHNELCVADCLLSDPSVKDSTVLYEPTLPNTRKTIDFCLRDAEGLLTLIDVKTIKPQPLDRWDQYERALREGWLPKHIDFIIEQEWQGGELWHTAFTSRSRFLEYSLEFEAKLEAAAYGAAAPRRILMFCGEGFYWHQDELADFVAYYRNGTHRGDDLFALVESRYVLERRVNLQRSISSFGCLSRRQGDVQPRRFNWHVEPGPEPFSRLDGA